MDMDRCFDREITAFFGKYTFNVHFLFLNVRFFILNIRFCILNIHFFSIQKFTDVKISIVKLIFLIQKQIFEKAFNILCCFADTFLQVRIIRTDKYFSYTINFNIIP